MVREFGIDTYTQLYLKRNTKKDLPYSTENSAQCYVDRGGDFGKNGYMHMYGSVPLLFI